MRVLFLVEDAKLNGGTEILARNIAGMASRSGRKYGENGIISR